MDNNISPYCKDKEIDLSDSYEDLYQLDPISEPEYNIVQMLKDKGVKLNKCIFVVFTVIALTATKNNPPNPPYVNTNKLIYAKRTKDDNKIKKALFDFITKLNQKEYTFYNNFSINIGSNTIKVADILTNRKYNQDIVAIRDFLNIILDTVTKTNAATLIGTLMATDELQNITFDKNICSISPLQETPFVLYNQNREDETKPFIPLSIEYMEGAKKKYLKYKNKYLALKEKLRNRQ
jgi:small nuclear ribonucleoprotein (snRNP)-like protein